MQHELGESGASATIQSRRRKGAHVELGVSLDSSGSLDSLERPAPELPKEEDEARVLVRRLPDRVESIRQARRQVSQRCLIVFRSGC